VIALGKTIGVDFDGTLHPYTNGWTGSEPDDEPPIPGALAFLEGLLADGYDVAIFSCRADHMDGEHGIIRWLRKHMPPIFYAMRDSQGKRVTVTDRKPPAIAYVDDRAVPFTGSWDQVRFAVDQLAAGRAHGAAPPAPGAEDKCLYHPDGPHAPHVPLASDEGGPVHCRYCQTMLKPRTA
jgi:hypothetical protein